MIDLEKRAKAWDEFSGESMEWTVSNTFNAAYALGVRDGVASVDRAVDMLLYCPNCFEQHVDEAKPDICELCGDDEETHGKNRDVGILCDVFTPWLNPDHKSHRCNFCNHVWRPADVPTNGVAKLLTKGERDESPRPTAFANGKDFQDSISAASIDRVQVVREIRELVQKHGDSYEEAVNIVADRLEAMEEESV